ncbi:MAG: ATP-binding protein [Planctomycetota bacterium]
MGIRNIVGNVPEPDELYGRDEFLAHLWRQIQGNNILMLAPRRFGKTGVMHHVEREPQKGYLPVYLDLEDVDSAEEFVWRLVRELLSHSRLRSFLQKVRRLPRSVTDWFKNTFDEAGFEGAKVKFKKSLSEDWRTVAKKLVVELEKAKPDLIFIFDELPAMLDEMCSKRGDDEARDFLAWFRSVRLQRKDRLRRHRFIVGGSIGIDLILGRLNAPDKLNDFERLYVEPIAKAEALRLAGDLAQSMEVQMTPKGIRSLLGLIGPNVPYFIHLILLAIGPVANRQASTVDARHAPARLSTQSARACLQALLRPLSVAIGPVWKATRAAGLGRPSSGGLSGKSRRERFVRRLP